MPPVAASRSRVWASTRVASSTRPAGVCGGSSCSTAVTTTWACAVLIDPASRASRVGASSAARGPVNTADARAARRPASPGLTDTSDRTHRPGADCPVPAPVVNGSPRAMPSAITASCTPARDRQAVSRPTTRSTTSASDACHGPTSRSVVTAVVSAASAARDRVQVSIMCLILDHGTDSGKEMQHACGRRWSGTLALVDERALRGVQGVRCVPDRHSGVGVLAVAGSSGRIDTDRARLFAQQGALAESLRWFGGPGQSPGPWEIPLELFSRRVDALAGECSRIRWLSG